MCYNTRVNNRKAASKERGKREVNKMYIVIDTIKNVKIGEPVVIRSDNRGGIGAFLIGGERIGELSGRQPEGCLDYWTIARSLYDNRVLCEVAIKCGDSAILSTQSRLFASLRTVKRLELEGYGMMIAK